jgi:PAS domain S-box-containing protein
MDEGYMLINSGIEQILYYQKHYFLSWKWWILFSMSVFPWLFAFIYLHKQKRRQYIISSLIIMVIASFLDIMGLTYNLWKYYVTVVPVLGGFFPWNFSIVPVLFVFSYQVFPKISPVLKGIIVSLMYAYLGEPFSDYLGFTLHNPWKHTYSVPIYFGIYLIAYYGGKRLSKMEDNEIKVQAEEKIQLNDKYHYAFNHSFDAIYLIEKRHLEKNFRFTEVNSSFCKEMGYSKEEVMKLDPRLISDQKSYNVDVKYRPLLKKGSMKIDTTFLTKSGEKKFVSLYAKVFWRKDKIEILSIVKFLENKVSDFEVN